jgi:hypothetical protein
MRTIVTLIVGAVLAAGAFFGTLQPAYGQEITEPASDFAPHPGADTPVKRYLVVLETSPQKMEQTIAAMIEVGWQPQGGVVASVMPSGVLVLFQAMVIVERHDDKTAVSAPKKQDKP